MAAASLTEQYEQLSIGFDEENVSFTTSSSHNEYPRSPLQFFFNFCFEPCIIDWVIPYGSTLPQIRRTIAQPLAETFVHVSSLDDEEKAREILGKKLQDWPIQLEKRKELVDIALDRAQKVVIKCMRPHQHNSVHLNFRVKVSHNFVYKENRAIVDHEVCKSMVPAAESSIESLEKKKLTDCGGACDYCCCVCLEEIVCGGESAMMPCGHGFHEHCINKWLRTSHYCPVCRFEMPKRE